VCRALQGAPRPPCTCPPNAQMCLKWPTAGSNQRQAPETWHARSGIGHRCAPLAHGDVPGRSNHAYATSLASGARFLAAGGPKTTLWPYGTPTKPILAPIVAFFACGWTLDVPQCVPSDGGGHAEAQLRCRALQHAHRPPCTSLIAIYEAQNTQNGSLVQHLPVVPTRPERRMGTSRS